MHRPSEKYTTNVWGASWNVKWCSHNGKTVWRFLKKLKWPIFSVLKRRNMINFKLEILSVRKRTSLQRLITADAEEALRKHRCFLGGSVVKNPPANAGNTGSSLVLEDPHKPRSNWAQVPRLLSLCPAVWEPQLLKSACLEPLLCNKRSHSSENPMQHI